LEEGSPDFHPCKFPTNVDCDVHLSEYLMHYTVQLNPCLAFVWILCMIALRGAHISHRGLAPTPLRRRFCTVDGNQPQPPSNNENTHIPIIINNRDRDEKLQRDAEELAAFLSAKRRLVILTGAGVRSLSSFVTLDYIIKKLIIWESCRADHSEKRMKGRRKCFVDLLPFCALALAPFLVHFFSFIIF
jgi:hypothetical protein